MKGFQTGREQTWQQLNQSSVGQVVANGEVSEPCGRYARQRELPDPFAIADPNAIRLSASGFQPFFRCSLIGETQSIMSCKLLDRYRHAVTFDPGRSRCDYQCGMTQRSSNKS